MGFLADVADNIGTGIRNVGVNVGDFGVSEFLNGGLPTANTGKTYLNKGVSNSIGTTPAYDRANNLVQSNTPQYYGLSSIPTSNSTNAIGGSSASSSSSDPYTQAQNAALAQQQAAANNQKAQLQGQLGTLDNQLNTGLSNIGNSYNNSYNRLGEQNAVASRDYNDSTASNGQNYQNTRNSIISNTRAQANALQRLLGQAGAGNSSAAYEQAPYAAGLQGSQNLGQAQGTYGTNQRSLDNNWSDTQRSYKNALDDLGQQKFSQENSLRSSIAQTRANLLSGIQNADGTSQYNGQINDLLSQISGLGNQYANPIALKNDISFASPTLASYGLGTQAAATNDQGGASSDVNPTFLGLLGQQRDQYGNLIQS